MKTNRRDFLATATLAGGATQILDPSSCSPSNASRSAKPDYSLLGEQLARPVLLREPFPDPVMIEYLTILRYRDNCIHRIRSKDGVEGISVGPSIYRRVYLSHALSAQLELVHDKKTPTLVHRIQPRARRLACPENLSPNPYPTARTGRGEE